MKTGRPIIVKVIVLVLIAATALVWALSLEGSIYSYRSPLRESPPQPGDPPIEPLTGRVVFVLVDALRVDTAHDESVMPFLASLREQGASALMHSRAPSYSSPGYSVLVTGAWPHLSDGPVFNLDYEDIPTITQETIFSAVSRTSAQTAISAFNWFEKLIPTDAVDFSYYTAGEDAVADRAVMDAALPWLEAGDAQLVLIHLDQVDHSGHVYGATSAEWNEAARNCDDHLREIIATLDFERDTLLVLSDHGQVDQGGHGGTETVVLQEPFLLLGAGVVPGEYGDIEMADIAPTIAVLLGADIPASSQGRVLTEMLALAPVQQAAIEAALIDQQAHLAEAYGSAIGQAVDVSDSPDVVTATRQAMDAALAAKLLPGRIVRLVIALIVTLGVIGLFAWKVEKPAGFLLTGIVVYLLVFNLGFKFLFAKNYSFSTVKSALDMIVTYAVLALLSVLVAFLVILWRSKAAKEAPTNRLLTLSLVIAAVHAIPALVFFVLYGPVIAAVLPDIAILYMALHGLLQTTFATVWGIALAFGLPSLVRIVTREQQR